MIPHIDCLGATVSSVCYMVSNNNKIDNSSLLFLNQNRLSKFIHLIDLESIINSSMINGEIEVGQLVKDLTRDIVRRNERSFLLPVNADILEKILSPNNLIPFIKSAIEYFPLLRTAEEEDMVSYFSIGNNLEKIVNDYMSAMKTSLSLTLDVDEKEKARTIKDSILNKVKFKPIKQSNINNIKARELLEKDKKEAVEKRNELKSLAIRLPNDKSLKQLENKTAIDKLITNIKNIEAYIKNIELSLAESSKAFNQRAQALLDDGKKTPSTNSKVKLESLNAMIATKKELEAEAILINGNTRLLADEKERLIISRQELRDKYISNAKEEAEIEEMIQNCKEDLTQVEIDIDRACLDLKTLSKIMLDENKKLHKYNNEEQNNLFEKFTREQINHYSKCTKKLIDKLKALNAQRVMEEMNMKAIVKELEDVEKVYPSDYDDKVKTKLEENNIKVKKTKVNNKCIEIEKNISKSEEILNDVKKDIERVDKLVSSYNCSKLERKDISEIEALNEKNKEDYTKEKEDLLKINKYIKEVNESGDRDSTVIGTSIVSKIINIARQVSIALRSLCSIGFKILASIFMSINDFVRWVIELVVNLIMSVTRNN